MRRLVSKSAESPIKQAVGSGQYERPGVVCVRCILYQDANCKLSGYLLAQRAGSWHLQISKRWVHDGWPRWMLLTSLILGSTGRDPIRSEGK